MIQLNVYEIYNICTIYGQMFQSIYLLIYVFICFIDTKISLKMI